MRAVINQNKEMRRAEKAVVEANEQAVLKEQKAERYKQRVAKLQELRQAVVLEQQVSFDKIYILQILATTVL